MTCGDHSLDTGTTTVSGLVLQSILAFVEFMLMILTTSNIYSLFRLKEQHLQMMPRSLICINTLLFISCTTTMLHALLNISNYHSVNPSLRKAIACFLALDFYFYAIMVVVVTKVWFKIYTEAENKLRNVSARRQYINKCFLMLLTGIWVAMTVLVIYQITQTVRNRSQDNLFEILMITEYSINQVMFLCSQFLIYKGIQNFYEIDSTIKKKIIICLTIIGVTSVLSIIILLLLSMKPIRVKLMCVGGGDGALNFWSFYWFIQQFLGQSLPSTLIGFLFSPRLRVKTTEIGEGQNQQSLVRSLLISNFFKHDHKTFYKTTQNEQSSQRLNDNGTAYEFGGNSSRQLIYDVSLIDSINEQFPESYCTRQKDSHFAGESDVRVKAQGLRDGSV